MVFHLSLTDIKSSQVFRTLINILADFNNKVVWMVTTRPLISKSSIPFNNFLVTVPRAQITNDLNWIVWTRTVYIYKNIFGIK